MINENKNPHEWLIVAVFLLLPVPKVITLPIETLLYSTYDLRVREIKLNTANLLT